jgi:prepilin-type N-terminal cleavage/methylation domain-containing protein
MGWNVFRKKRAFTLIEILIVMATIGLISTSAVAVIDPINLNNKANDTKRLADIEKIKIAQEEYVNDKGCYPSTSPVLTQTFDPNSFLYVTDISDCPKWYVLFSEITSYKETTSACNLDPSCLPVNYLPNWSCTVVGNYECEVIAASLLPGIPIPTNTPRPVPTSREILIPTGLATQNTPTTSSCYQTNKEFPSTSQSNCCPGLIKSCYINYSGAMMCFCRVNLIVSPSPTPTPYPYSCYDLWTTCTSGKTPTCCSGYYECINSKCLPKGATPTPSPVPTWSGPCMPVGSTCNIYAKYNGCCTGFCSGYYYAINYNKCCVDDWGNCNQDSDCCGMGSSTRRVACISGVCQPNDGIKLSVGATCIRSSQCNTGICDKNKCIYCKDVGEAMTSARQCCYVNIFDYDGSVCTDYRPSPTPTAVPLAACIPLGNYCYSGKDYCCGDGSFCLSHICRDARPTMVPYTCVKARSTCGNGGLPCCSGLVCQDVDTSDRIKLECRAPIGEKCGVSYSIGGVYSDHGDCVLGAACWGGVCQTPSTIKLSPTPTPDIDKGAWGSACTSDVSGAQNNYTGGCIQQFCDNGRCAQLIDGIVDGKVVPVYANCVPAGGGPIGTEVSRCCSGKKSGSWCL